MKRGTISMEYLTLVALVLLVMLFFIGTMQQSSQSIKLSQAKDAVVSIANAVESVSRVGTGNKETVWINLPPGITNITFKGKELTIFFVANGNMNDAHQTTTVEMVGGIPVTAGLEQVIITAINRTSVGIGTLISLLQVIPNCADKSKLPLDVTLKGDNFHGDAQVLINDVEYFTVHQSGYVNVTSLSEMHFLADEEHFESIPLGMPYSLKVRNGDGVVSNAMTFKVVSNQNFCTGFGKS